VVCGRPDSIGSVAYQAPENANRNISFFFSQTKADVYSLGLILLRLMYNVLVYSKPHLDCRNFRLLYREYTTNRTAQPNNEFYYRGVIGQILAQFPVYSPSLMILLEDMLCPDFLIRPSIKKVIQRLKDIDWTLPDLSLLPHLTGVSPARQRKLLLQKQTESFLRRKAVQNVTKIERTRQRLIFEALKTKRNLLQDEVVRYNARKLEKFARRYKENRGIDGKQVRKVSKFQQFVNGEESNENTENNDNNESFVRGKDVKKSQFSTAPFSVSFSSDISTSSTSDDEDDGDSDEKISSLGAMVIEPNKNRRSKLFTEDQIKKKLVSRERKQIYNILTISPQIRLKTTSDGIIAKTPFGTVDDLFTDGLSYQNMLELMGKKSIPVDEVLNILKKLKNFKKMKKNCEDNCGNINNILDQNLSNTSVQIGNDDGLNDIYSVSLAWKKLRRFDAIFKKLFFHSARSIDNKKMIKKILILEYLKMTKKFKKMENFEEIDKNNHNRKAYQQNLYKRNQIITNRHNKILCIQYKQLKRYRRDIFHKNFNFWNKKFKNFKNDKNIRNSKSNQIGHFFNFSLDTLDENGNGFNNINNGALFHSKNQQHFSQNNQNKIAKNNTQINNGHKGGQINPSTRLKSRNRRELRNLGPFVVRLVDSQQIEINSDEKNKNGDFSTPPFSSQNRTKNPQQSQSMAENELSVAIQGVQSVAKDLGLDKSD
jgi:hypothetical protein